MRVQAAILCCFAMSLSARCGVAAPPAGNKPLPEITALLRDVEAHQRQLDRAREDYTFHDSQTLIVLDKHGKMRHSESKESYVFFVNGQHIEKLIKKDGKALSAGDARKEDDRVAKEVEKYSKAGSGHPDKDEVSVGRLLSIVTFSHPRRIDQNGRSKIAIDFVGDPHAKTHGRNEEALKRVFGTVSIDEAAREVSHMDATFDENLHIGFGMLATLDKGSTVSFNQALINNEVWLPTALEGRFNGRALMLVGFHVTLSVHFDDYRKFGASATEATARP